MVRREVEEREARIVMIDSVAGYRLSLHDEDLVAHLHALAKYLQNMGVAVLLINEVEAIVGDFRATDVGVSYMSDNIIFLRYLERLGEMTKAIGVLKKRLSDFEKTLRELTITPEGIRVGPKLSAMRGILPGTPEWGLCRRPRTERHFLSRILLLLENAGEPASARRVAGAAARAGGGCGGRDPVSTWRSPTRLRSGGTPIPDHPQTGRGAGVVSGAAGDGAAEHRAVHRAAVQDGRRSRPDAGRKSGIDSHAWRCCCGRGDCLWNCVCERTT